jgi:hypothetical protein
MFDVRLNGHLSASRNAKTEWEEFTFLQLMAYQRLRALAGATICLII